MQFTFLFPAKDVLGLIALTEQATAHIPALTEAFDETFKPIHKPTAAPALQFVKDRGVYLRSNAKDQPTVVRDGQEVIANLVYAIGYGPESDHIRGDDFCEHFPIADLAKFRLDAAQYFYVRMDMRESTMEIGSVQNAESVVH